MHAIFKEKHSHKRPKRPGLNKTDLKPLPRMISQLHCHGKRLSFETNERRINEPFATETHSCLIGSKSKFLVVPERAHNYDNKFQ